MSNKFYEEGIRVGSIIQQHHNDILLSVKHFENAQYNSRIEIK